MAIIQYAEQPCGIIQQGERGELVRLISDRLHSLGLLRTSGDVYTPEVNDALNSYRLANKLPTADYCDPVTLRLLCGVDAGGDELVLLARACEVLLPDANELERFDFCREIVGAGEDICERFGLLSDIGRLLVAPMPSAETVKSALLAYMLRSE